MISIADGASSRRPYVLLAQARMVKCIHPAALSVAMPCYFQGCSGSPTTKEHVPPKSFFPKDQRDQLLTVPSCPKHNNAKSSDDVYVLAHICMNASPANRAREIFSKVVVPQLEYNEDALRKTLAGGAVSLPAGGVAYKVDVRRFDHFFTALSSGIVFKASGVPLPEGYEINHLYYDLVDKGEPPELAKMKEAARSFYSGAPENLFDFGQIRALNASIYCAKVFGLSSFRSSITIVHEFYGKFTVMSFLTKRVPDAFASTTYAR